MAFTTEREKGRERVAVKVPAIFQACDFMSQTPQ